MVHGMTLRPERAQMKVSFDILSEEKQSEILGMAEAFTYAQKDEERWEKTTGDRLPEGQADVGDF
jgi:hypothetical protein